MDNGVEAFKTSERYAVALRTPLNFRGSGGRTTNQPKDLVATALKRLD
jgi:hypothetical protein